MAATKLVVRLNVTNEVANQWQSGQARQLEANAKEQAERAAKVRYLGQGVRVELVGTEEAWISENGQAKVFLDFTYNVIVS